MVSRCGWVNESDPLYVEYHDLEWGRAQYDGQKLFEKLCLEGQQAGLSWITVLRKREEYRRCFFAFSAEKIVQINDIEPFLANRGLIRNRSKIQAIINNAAAYLTMQKQGVSFSDFIWSFVDGKPIINHYKTLSELPAKNAVSEQMSKALIKRGFKYVGPTICYAFMQSMGLVNDHIVDCFCYPHC